jgi:hypothetical protein
MTCPKCNHDDKHYFSDYPLYSKDGGTGACTWEGRQVITGQDGFKRYKQLRCECDLSPDDIKLNLGIS